MEIITNKEYQWNQNWASKIVHTDINLVVSELKEIEEVHGKINPDLVIESSKNKKSILHNYFEWDNDKAANLWRVKQASKLLSCITIKTIKDGKPIVMQAYQVTKNTFGNQGDVSYKKFDTITPENILFIKNSAIGDLLRIKNKLLSHDIMSPISFIESAIEALQKESTETDKQPTELKAVS